MSLVRRRLEIDSQGRHVVPDDTGHGVRGDVDAGLQTPFVKLYDSGESSRIDRVRFEFQASRIHSIHN